MKTKRIKDSAHQNETEDLSQIFKPVEHAVLARVLRCKNLLPDWAGHIDLSEFPKTDWNEAKDGIAPTKPIQENSLALGNAAARIALATIQDKLPQWGSFTPGYGITLSRTLRLYPVRRVNSQPLHLFSINWAESGPGFSWPEAYYVTWIPYYDRFVVTASADSKDFFGFEDILLGSFAGSPEKGADLRAIRESIIAFWIKHHNDGYEAWEGLIRVGAIKNTTVHAWKSKVWNKRNPVPELW